MLYDAWNRLVFVWVDDDSDGQADAGETVIAQYEYDGLNRRTKVFSNDDTDDDFDRWQHFYYNSRWQILETRETTTSENTEPEGLVMVYDAWNRLAAVYTDDGTTAGEKDDDDTLIAEYRYDGRHRRIAKIEPDAAHSGKYVRTDYYYSLGWQVVEERRDDDLASKDTVASTLKYQYVWGVRYIDAPICRDEDTGDGSGGDPDGDCIDSDDEHLYYTQDANFNVTALVDGSDGDVVERYMYSPYGEVTVLHGDRDSSGTDTSADEWSARTSNTFENALLYCGYYHDWETGLYHVRHRYYVPPLGRWLTRDPIGYQDGMGLYEYARGEPVSTRDPKGLKVWAHEITAPDAAVSRTAGGEALGHAFKIGLATVQAQAHAYKKARRTLRSQNLYPFGYLGYKTYFVGGNNAFVYTCGYGWLDLGHFFQSAFWAYATGSSTVALTAGMLVEMEQEWHHEHHLPGEDWRESHWTAEDIPSDLLGSDFGKEIYDKDKTGKAIKRGSWRVHLRSTSIAKAFERKLVEWGAVSHQQPIVLPILEMDADSWLGPSGNVIPDARQKSLPGALSFQRQGIAYFCLCDGDQPKPEYRWQP